MVDRSSFAEVWMPSISRCSLRWPRPGAYSLLPAYRHRHGQRSPRARACRIQLPLRRRSGGGGERSSAPGRRNCTDSVTAEVLGKGVVIVCDQDDWLLRHRDDLDDCPCPPRSACPCRLSASSRRISLWLAPRRLAVVELEPATRSRACLVRWSEALKPPPPSSCRSRGHARSRSCRCRVFHTGSAVSSPATSPAPTHRPA